MTEATYCLEDLPARLSAKIAVHPVSGCWVGQWKPVAKGYIRIYWLGKLRYLHRVVYELLVGPIPDGLDLDHVKARGCIDNACCWPAHLEPVTNLVNVRRSPNTLASINAAKEKCPVGHDLVPGNLVKRRLPYRICLTCDRDRARDAARRRRTSHVAERIAVAMERTAEAVRMRAEGLSRRQIALRLGIKHDTVTRYLAWHDAGVIPGAGKPGPLCLPGRDISLPSG